LGFALPLEASVPEVKSRSYARRRSGWTITRTANTGILSRKLAYWPSELSYILYKSPWNVTPGFLNVPLFYQTTSQETAKVRISNSLGNRLASCSLPQVLPMAGTAASLTLRNPNYSPVHVWDTEQEDEQVDVELWRTPSWR